MRTVILAVAFVALSGGAQTGKPPAPTVPDERPITTFPYTPGLDVSSMDRTADACVDFYQYSCGGWMKNNPIPADQARWSVYGKLSQDNQRFLWGILERLSKQQAGRDANQQKIGDFFGACTDEAAVNALGATPLKPYLERIAGMKTVHDLPAVMADLHLSIATSGLLFTFTSSQDFENSESVIAFAGAGGLGLPDRDYYTKQDDKSKNIRAQYVVHVQRMFALLGDLPSIAPREAATVMEIETALAKASLTRVEQREPHNLFHKVAFKGLQELTPDFDWAVYVKSLGLPAQATVNVTEPAFYKEVGKQLKTRPIDDLRTYLRWHTVHAEAPFLSNDFVMENFSFFSKTLRGVPQLRPRWKRCVSLVDSQLGDALGQEFVKRAFSPELKQRALTMTTQIERAMADDINSLTWMSPETKAQALAKLHGMVNKIGYPEKWRDYSAVQVNARDFLGNVDRTTRFKTRYELNKIGKPVDHTEWTMTPPTVNAYYDPQMNDINFPAGVLQPPLYDAKMDDAPNYGNTGGTIGHELTHGFDDEGRQFDAHGNLKDWWTESDAKAFTDRAQCVVDQYAQYTVVDEIKINSKLTEGEDIADLGGLILAWIAWRAQTSGQELVPRDGLTPEQRFFVGYAQWACENDRPENLRANAVVDPHSPGKYRVNGLVVNMPEFQKAFACRPGQPMVKENRCRVW
jgi:putative endopeptidase